MSELIRRLPVYFVLDCSVSMVGEGIEAVQRGLKSLVNELKSDPHALETAWLSVITFSSYAEQIIPLTDITEFQVPDLKIHPGTKLGAALSLLRDCIQKEVRLNTPDQKGDWLPLVFLLTDGEPTDEWTHPAQKLNTLFSGKPLNLIAIGCGPDVNSEILYQLTESVFILKDDSPEDFQKLFRWITASISTASQNIEVQGSQLISSDFPKDLLDKASKDTKISGSQQRQLFLTVQCSKMKEYFLIRFRLNEDETGFDPVKTHKIDKDYLDETVNEDDASHVSSDMLHGILPCPHCENNVVAKCPCGAIFCCSENDEYVVCPACNRKLSLDLSPDSIDFPKANG
ncbi:MAG: TerY-C metal binding domain-containing protein [Candidatus Hodarchaeota archaeon]